MRKPATASRLTRSDFSRFGSCGFTYIGLLIAIAIIGGASATALSAGATLQRRLAEEELLFVGAQFRQAFRSYYESAVSLPRYPATLEALLQDPRPQVAKRHLRKVFHDPLTGKAEWGLIPAPGGGIMGVHSLAEGKPIKQANFDPAFALFEAKGSYLEWSFAWSPTSGRPPRGSVSAATTVTAGTTGAAGVFGPPPPTTANPPSPAPLN